MAVTVSVYNHTSVIFAQGLANASPGTGAYSTSETIPTYKVALYTNNPPTFDATDLLMTDVGLTEVSNAGYTAGGVALTNVTVTQSGNDAIFDADDFSVTASGAAISAYGAILYRAAFAADNNDRPLLHFNFGGVETAADGTDFKIVWSASGIFSFIVAG